MSLPTSVNVKISYRDKIKRRNDVTSVKALHQVIEELFKDLYKKQYEISYTDNEKDNVTIESQKCFEAAIDSVYNKIYYNNPQIKKDCDNSDVRRKLVILNVKINEISEEKYDGFEAINNKMQKPFKFSWCTNMKGKNIQLSENNMKSQLMEGVQFHGVRGSIPIPKGSTSVWKMIIFIDRSTSGNFYGLISSEAGADVFVKAWYDCALKETIYGVDDNPSYVYQGGARQAPEWKVKAIPFKQETELKYTADYTQDCCVLTIAMNGAWLYQFLLPPNKEWFPAVQFEEPGSWARIVN